MLHALQRLAAPLLVVATLGLFASGSAMAETQYPLTIEHAFGATVLEAKPERVATVAWANHEVPLALGIVPVGMAAANFGDDDGDGLLPWVKEKLTELGAATPVLFDEGDGIDFEGVAATNPDVILAAYSGLSQQDYDTLSQIAPVVPYPEAAWSTDWREMIEMNSLGMGMEDEGKALIASIETEIAESVAQYPQLQDKPIMFVTHLDTTDLSLIKFYSANDTRVKFFEDLGLKMPQSVVAATQPGQFSGEISAEQVDQFDDVRIVVTYGGDELIDAMKADPLVSRMPAVASDSLVLLKNDPLGTAANPTPLAINWVLDDYLALLAAAADKAE